jgi:hypothetical protein
MLLTHTAWIRNSPSFPEHPEYMEVLSDVGRIVCAIAGQGNPVQYIPMTMTYVNVAEGLIRTRLLPNSNWKDDTYRVEGDLMFWNDNGDNESPWQVLPPDQLPSWFLTFRDRALSAMDRRWVVR